METPKPHREQFEEMVNNHSEQKKVLNQELDQKQAEELAAMKDSAHEEALKDNERLTKLREEMKSITGSEQPKAQNEKEVSFESLRKDWKDFYKETFGIESDFSKIEIPKKQEGFERLIIMEKGMTAQKLFDKCRELFSAYKYTEKDLDEIITSDRNAKKAYAIWIRERVEADEELKNLSARDLKEKGIITETLEERLLDEIRYFNQTGQHLDIKNVTLCSGSRNSDGHVPNVDFDGGKMGVNWRNLDNRDEILRARQVVS